MIVDHVVDAQSGVVALQDREHFLTKPSGIADFECPAYRAWRRFKEVSEAVRIDIPIWRQLHQNRAEKLS